MTYRKNTGISQKITSGGMINPFLYAINVSISIWKLLESSTIGIEMPVGKTWDFSDVFDWNIWAVKAIDFGQFFPQHHGSSGPQIVILNNKTIFENVMEFSSV